MGRLCKRRIVLNDHSPLSVATSLGARLWLRGYSFSKAFWLIFGGLAREVIP
jgi:hypothetical protein